MFRTRIPVWGTLGRTVKQSVKSVYSDLCQGQTRVWEHLHLFSIIPHICCRMYVIHLVIQEITFVANSLPIRNFIEFVYHAVASYEVWELVIFGVPAVVTFCMGPSFRPGMGWESLGCLGFLRTKSWHCWWVIIWGRGGTQNNALCLHTLQTYVISDFSISFGTNVLNSPPCGPFPVSFETCSNFQTVLMFGLRGHCPPQGEECGRVGGGWWLLEPFQAVSNLKISSFFHREATKYPFSYINIIVFLGSCW